MMAPPPGRCFAHFAGHRSLSSNLLQFRERSAALAAVTAVLFACVAAGQEPAEDPSAEAGGDAVQVAPSINVDPESPDQAIAARLERILAATGWYEDSVVTVDQGIVFLSGRTTNDQRRDWAAEVARSTEDVVAVINDIRVGSGSIVDLSPAWSEIKRLSTAAVRHLPIVTIALIVLLVTFVISRRSVSATSALLERRLSNPLLRNVASRMVAIPLFLLGLYFALSMLGLTGLAVTIVGGTGLAGLIVGFAFRDIAENFLASVLLSMQKPFATGDFIEVTGHQGFVQSVNTRSTLLMTREGNHVQIPNSVIYKNTIINFTANPLARYDFLIGIGYDDSIAEAQRVASEVLARHPAISDAEEALVLVESLGPSTVNLRAYFWIDVTEYSFCKVTSAVIRLTKRAFEEAGISMPDEAREVVFPNGVPVQLSDDRAYEQPTSPASSVSESPRRSGGDGNGDSASEISEAEVDLKSEAKQIDDQARRARKPEGATNLLES